LGQRGGGGKVRGGQQEGMKRGRLVQGGNHTKPPIRARNQRLRLERYTSKGNGTV